MARAMISRPDGRLDGSLSRSYGSSDTAFVRFPLPAYATVLAGLAVMTGGAFAAAHHPLTALTLLAAAALAAELLEEPESVRLREPLGRGAFRVASGVHVAAVIVVGPWRGALVAGAGVLLARAGRSSWRNASFQAAAFA